jgi:hypothetical protein
MTAGALLALRLLKAHDVAVKWTGDGVDFDAPTKPPDDVMAVLDAHEQAIVALMKPDWAGLSGMDWRANYYRRLRERLRCGAAREMAVVEAFQRVLTGWLNSHLQATSPIRCAHCGRPEDALYAGVLLPFGVGPHAWVHSRCWEAWRAARRRKAIETLAGCGVTAAEGVRTSCQKPAARTGDPEEDDNDDKR